MRISIYAVLLFVTSLLNGCGGGGGAGAGSSSTTTSCTQTSPCVFTSGVTMKYLRHMLFDGSYLYVIDSDTNACCGNSHLRQFSASTGNYITTYEKDANSLQDAYSIAKFKGGIVVSGLKNAAPGNGIISIDPVAPNYTSVTEKYHANPYGLAVDTGNITNRLYVTDQTANSVSVYDTSYTLQTTNFATNVNADWVRPTGVAYDGVSNIYVTAFGGGSKGLYKINTNTYSVISISNTAFKQPNGVVVNTSSGEIYVVNTGTTDTNSSVLKISANGSTVSTFLDGSNSSSKLCGPVGVAISGSYLYISNSSCIANTAYANAVIKVSM